MKKEVQLVIQGEPVPIDHVGQQKRDPGLFHRGFDPPGKIVPILPCTGSGRAFFPVDITIPLDEPGEMLREGCHKEILLPSGA